MASCMVVRGQVKSRLRSSGSCAKQWTISDSKGNWRRPVPVEHRLTHSLPYWPIPAKHSVCPPGCLSTFYFLSWAFFPTLIMTKNTYFSSHFLRLSMSHAEEEEVMNAHSDGALLGTHASCHPCHARVVPGSPATQDRRVQGNLVHSPSVCRLVPRLSLCPRPSAQTRGGGVWSAGGSYTIFLDFR